jgi:hypothetical protein
MPSGRLACRWEGFGVRRRARTLTGVYISLKLVYIVWFLVRKVDSYYRKYKEGIIDSSDQLKR